MVKGLDDLAPEGLLDRVRKAAGLVDDAARVRIFCHYDPDGTTSASILTRALMRRGKRIHATMAHVRGPPPRGIERALGRERHGIRPARSPREPSVSGRRLGPL